MPGWHPKGYPLPMAFDPYVLDEFVSCYASQSSLQNRRDLVAIGPQEGLRRFNLVFFGLAVGLDLLGVLPEIDGEAGVAGGVADEVEVVGLGGVKGSAEGGEAGVGDGAGGEAGVFVGVVGRGGLEVGGVEGAAPAAVEQGGVDDGGVGGEGD